MIRLIGFEAQSGTFTSENTGEVIAWSNRLFRCVTDEDLGEREYGLKIFEQKFNTAQVIAALNLNENSSELGVDSALKSILNKCITFEMGLVKGKFEVKGFKVIQEPTK